jgi:hypothetical protein
MQRAEPHRGVQHRGDRERRRRAELYVAVQVEFESTFLKPVFHFIGTREGR